MGWDVSITMDEDGKDGMIDARYDTPDVKMGLTMKMSQMVELMEAIEEAPITNG